MSLRLREEEKKNILAVSRKEHTPHKNGCGTGEHRKTKPGPGFKLGYSKSGDLLTAISEPARCHAVRAFRNKQLNSPRD